MGFLYAWSQNFFSQIYRHGFTEPTKKTEIIEIGSKHTLKKINFKANSEFKKKRKPKENYVGVYKTVM